MLSIRSYTHGQRYRPDAARPGGTTQDVSALTTAYGLLRTRADRMAAQRPSSYPWPRNPRDLQHLNPHIQRGEDGDDFILVTQVEDFVEFVRMGRNVVLQSTNPRQDGSLSVRLGNRRFITVEAETGRGRTAGLGSLVVERRLRISHDTRHCPERGCVSHLQTVQIYSSADRQR
jgi:hypothetical protein